MTTGRINQIRLAWGSAPQLGCGPPSLLEHTLGLAPEPWAGFLGVEPGIHSHSSVVQQPCHNVQTVTANVGPFLGLPGLMTGPAHSWICVSASLSASLVRAVLPQTRLATGFALSRLG